MANDPSLDHLVRRLRLRHLDLLVTLAEVGTVRGTATRLALSQPAVSKMLAELEESLGVRLFDRSRRGMAINPAGEVAVRRARLALAELARTPGDLAALKAGAAEVLRLGAPSVTATIPVAVVALQKQLPKVSVQIREGRVRELIQRLLEGELDAVFGAVTPELLTSDVVSRLQSDVLLDDHLCVLAATSNERLGGGRWRWRDLRADRWVAPPRETLVRQGLMTAFLNDGADPPEPVIEAISSVTIGTVLRLDPSLLCAVRFEHAREEVARGGARQVAVGPRMALPSLGLFTRRDDSSRSPALDSLAEAIRASAADAGKESEMLSIASRQRAGRSPHRRK